MGPFSVGAPKPEDVKMIKKELKYIPFWRVQATYVCRYVRRGTYHLKIPEDVEEVKVYGKLQQVVGQRRRLSDLMAAVGASAGMGYGPISISLTSLEGVMKSGMQKALGSKDKEMGRQAETDHFGGRGTRFLCSKRKAVLQCKLGWGRPKYLPGTRECLEFRFLLQEY